MARIEVQDIGVSFPVLGVEAMSLKLNLLSLFRSAIPHKPQTLSVQALQSITFELNDGDRLGIIGPNGCGKTTLLRALAGIYEPSEGWVRVTGSTSTLFDLTIGIDPEISGTDNIYLRGYAQGMTRRAIAIRERDICDLSGLGDRLQDPVRTYSDGMRLRLAFATALMSPHDILLIDEIVGVGDAAFLMKAHEKLISSMAESRIVVLASHALDLVEMFCNRGLYLRQGRIAAIGPIKDVIGLYRRDLAA